jgi:ribonuclease E
MADKMLIDATHPEETRVVVLRGNRVEEFDFESANRKQLRGNIYLAKVTRVEPSLQAAFVDYGGNRHGFLAFSEIHPDYYQIPVADRQALLEQEERDQRAADADADHRANRRGRGGRHRHRGADRHRGRDVRRSEPLPNQDQPADEFAHDAAGSPAGEIAMGEQTPEQIADTAAVMAATTPAAEHEAEQLVREEVGGSADESAMEAAPQPEADASQPAGETAPSFEAFASADMPEAGDDHGESGDHLPASAEAAPPEDRDGRADPANGNGEEHSEEEAVESVGGADALEEVQERMPRFRRQYKIQEVIKRRQVMLVQVVKEERGTKGAALTTYLSLAGRYSVLMPNTARGGGISRKITSSEDRARLKDIAQELETPPGMGVILRTAGASRTKTEVKRDFEYLMRLWETVRDLTLKSTAPKLVYEEGSLAKRSIRDLYSKDIEEIVVAGDDGYKECRDFMRMLMPSHVKHVKLYKDSQPIFTRYGIESQLDAMFSPVVQLRSGGYIVINQAEALVAIDVNSGRATREHHIEDTALKTNGEAAEEIARQLRLRDLAGLIVIDFIDMDETRNNRSVERRLKEALKYDRARIQVGRISHFGLLEMSRQRIRSSVLESSTEKCPVCGGSGHVRSVSSVSLQLLRALEEMLVKGATHNLIVRTRSEVALYVLNHKRAHLRALEERFRITITISADATVTGQQSYVIDRGEQVHSVEAAKALAAAASPALSPPIEEDEEIFEDETEAAPESEEASAVSDVPQAAPVEADGEPRRDGGRRRRRGRGRGRGRGGEPREPRDGAPNFTPETEAEPALAHEDDGGAPAEDEVAEQPHQGGAPLSADGADHDGARRRRRRGRRGGRRNRRERGNGDAPFQSGGDAPFPANGGEAEPELRHAVEDLDRPPSPRDAGGADRPMHASFPPVSGEEADALAPRFDRAPEAPPAKAAPAEPEPSPEPQRRRSTVREPAPFAVEDAPPSPTLPPPTPVISSTAADATATPKRGWWGKRLMGDKD